VAEQTKPPKKGLETTVAGLLELDDGPPPTQKPPVLVNGGVIPPAQPQKPATKPVQARGQGRAPYRGPIVPKGSQLAPKRESSADYIDGRSERATGRNSRLNLSLSEIHLNAFKWGVKNTGMTYNELFESWVEANFPQIYADLVEAAREEREAIERLREST